MIIITTITSCGLLLQQIFEIFTFPCKEGVNRTVGVREIRNMRQEQGYAGDTRSTFRKKLVFFE